MKILRISMYYPHAREPVTVVVRERDASVPLGEFARRMEIPPTFTASEVFEVAGEPTIAEAALAAHRRLRDSARLTEELDMALCYYWNAGQLILVRPGGTLVNPRPAPLGEEQLRTVVRQLRLLPHYRGQRIVTTTRDGAVLECDENGEFRTWPSSS